jgi:hypothetical protein
VPALDEKVTVRRRDVNTVRHNGFVIFRVCGVDRPGPIQHLRQHAANIRRHVPDNEQRGRQVIRQIRHEFFQSLKAPGVSPDDDHVPDTHYKIPR